MMEIHGRHVVVFSQVKADARAFPIRIGDRNFPFEFLIRHAAQARANYCCS